MFNFKSSWKFKSRFHKNKQIFKLIYSQKYRQLYLVICWLNVFAQNRFLIQWYYIIEFKFNTIHYSDPLVTYYTAKPHSLTHIFNILNCYVRRFVLHFQVFWDNECPTIFFEIDTKNNILSQKGKNFFRSSQILLLFVKYFFRI